MASNPIEPLSGPSGGEVIRECDSQLADRGGAGHRASVSDPVLRELDIRNISRAIADGGLDARVQLGAVIGRLLLGEGK